MDTHSPSLEPPTHGPCRYCGRHAWTADKDGPAHRCCTLWAEVMAKGHPCPSCEMARLVAIHPRNLFRIPFRPVPDQWLAGTNMQRRTPGAAVPDTPSIPSTPRHHPQ